MVKNDVGVIDYSLVWLRACSSLVGAHRFSCGMTEKFLGSYKL